MNFVKFSITATNLNLADTTDQTLFTLKTNTSIARVPTRLVLYKAAGTAYTVDSGSRLEVKDSNGQLLFSIENEGFLDQATVEGRAMAPASSGLVFQDGGITSFALSSTGSIASGTGSLEGKLFYDEEGVIW